MNESLLPDEKLIVQFLDYLEMVKGRTPGTVNAYRLRLRRLAKWLHDQDKSLLKASFEDLEYFTSFHLHALGMTPRSRIPSISAVRHLYQYLHQRGQVRENVAIGLERPKIGESLPIAMELGQFGAMFTRTDLTTFIGIRDAAILAVLGGCGLRVSGLTNLNEEDLIVGENSEGWETAYFRVSEKGDRERFVPIPDDTLLLLRAYLAHDELKAMERTTKNGWRVLFVSTRNHSVPIHERYGEALRLGPRGVWAIIKKLGKLARLPNDVLHPHSFRHMFGRELAEDGVDLDRRASLLGHVKVETTRIYDRISMRRLRETVNKSSPIAKVRTPVTDLKDMLRRGAAASE